MTPQLNLDALTPQVLRIAAKTRSEDEPSASVSCKTEVFILPLRYAVIASSDDQALQTLAPDLPAYLDSGLPPLQDGQLRYAVRTMRMGYLYLFTKRLGQDWICESAYRAFDSGLLKRVLPYSPKQYSPLDNPLLGSRPSTYNLHGPGESGPGGWTLRLKTPEDIEELRMLFTPDPLTADMLNKVCDSSMMRNRLQKFDVRQLMMSCSRTQDVLDPHIIDETLADAIVEDAPEHAPVLAQQLYSNAQTQYARRTVALDLKETPRRARGFAVVLHDAIAITQQLNSWRNAAYEQLQQYLDKADDQGIDNQRKVLVAQAFIDVKKQFQSRTAALEAQHYIDIERARVYDPAIAAGRNMVLNDDEREHWDQEADKYVAQFEDTMRQRVQSKLDSGEYQRRFDAKYLTPAQPGQAVRVADMETELGKFESVSAAAEAIGEERAKDHEHWLKSEQLLTALDVYDDKDLVSGWHFAGQTGLCVLGADGCKSTAELISQWWQGNPTDRANLALRGFALNQREIQAELQRTLDEAKTKAHVPVFSTDQLLMQVKAGFETVQHLANLFDKANSVYEELATAGETNLAGGALAWYSSLGRQTLRHSPRGMEWFFHGITRNWLAASISKRAVNLRIDELTKLGRIADPKQMRAQIGRNTRFAFATELVDARRSEFYGVRAASWLLLFEAALISLRLQDFPDHERGAGELAAHLLLAGAAGTEILALGTYAVMEHYSRASVTGLGATMFFGQLKLLGGVLGAVGGVVLMGYDWEDRRSATLENKPVLSFAFLTRFGASLAMVVSQSSIAIAAAGPMFKILAERGARTWLSTAFIHVALELSTLLGRQAILALLRSILLRGTVLGVSASIAIYIFDDDALQKWCKRCLYRGQDYQTNKLFDGTGKELAALYGALMEVV